MNYCLFVVAVLVCTALAVTNTTMPSYYAVGKTAKELGQSIGMQQKEAFQELVKADDSLFTVLVPWMQRHPDIYQSFCEANQAAYPDIFDEILGIAEGAGINHSYAILLMLRPEIESLAGAEQNISYVNENCFDIINNPADENGVAFIAHNEDWTPAYKPYGFVLHENMPFSTTGATHITAFTYPASPVGFTFGYNDKGLVTSCNGLNPQPCHPGKLGRYFINRDVLAATSMDDAIERLQRAAPNSSLGFAMSIGFVGNRTMFHAEMAPYDPAKPTEDKGCVDIIRIDPGQSYLHSNAYTHEYFKDIKQNISQSTQHRLARANNMTAPTTPELALAILGDETTPVYPIYRYGIPPDELATISTALLNLDNATVTIYGGNPTRFEPVVVMPLFQPVPPKPQPQPDSNNDQFGAPFIIAASLAGVFFIVSVVVIAVLAMKSKGNNSNSINSSYSRVA